MVPLAADLTQRESRQPHDERRRAPATRGHARAGAAGDERRRAPPWADVRRGPGLGRHAGDVLRLDDPAGGAHGSVYAAGVRGGRLVDCVLQRCEPDAGAGRASPPRAGRAACARREPVSRGPASVHRESSRLGHGRGVRAARRLVVCAGVEDSARCGPSASRPDSNRRACAVVLARRHARDGSLVRRVAGHAAIRTGRRVGLEGRRSWRCRASAEPRTAAPGDRPGCARDDSPDRRRPADSELQPPSRCRTGIRCEPSHDRDDGAPRVPLSDADGRPAVLSAAARCTEGHGRRRCRCDDQRCAIRRRQHGHVDHGARVERARQRRGPGRLAHRERRLLQDPVHSATPRPIVRHIGWRRDEPARRDSERRPGTTLLAR